MWTRRGVTVERRNPPPGGLPPDRLVEAEDAILADCQRVIQRYHDPHPYARLRVGLAPCSPFSVTGDLMREAAALARSYDKVYLHTHVAETQDEERFCLEKFGVRPAEYMRQLGWVGPDVWWAHAVWLDEAEIQMLAETGTGVAHCPSSNMRLGSGIAKIRQMRQSGVKGGVGSAGAGRRGRPRSGRGAAVVRAPRGGSLGDQRPGGRARRPAGGDRTRTADRAPQPAGPGHGGQAPGQRRLGRPHLEVVELPAGGQLLFEVIDGQTHPALRQAAVAELRHLLIVDEEGELIALRQHLQVVDLPRTYGRAGGPIQQRRQ